MSPRRQRGEGSLFKRESDGLWVGRVELGWIDGKRKRKTVYGKTQREVVLKLRDARKAADQGDLSTRATTVAQWLTSWVEQVVPAKPNIKPGTLGNYRSIVYAHLIPAVGNVRLDRLSLQHVRSVHKHCRDAGLSPTTVGHVHRAFGTAMNDALREGLVTRNVVSLVPKPASDIEEREPLTLAQTRRFFAAIEGDRLASRWHTAFLLGLRQGECLGLRWSMLDLDKGKADVAWQLQGLSWQHGCGSRSGKTWPCGRRADHCPSRSRDLRPGLVYEPLADRWVLQKPKAGSQRMVPLPEPLVASLRHRHELYLVEREQYETDHDLVWTDLTGRPVNPRHDRESWHAALKAAEIPPTDQHSARHTTATLLLALGVPERVIGSILGHSQVVTTRGYAHSDLSMQKEAIAGLSTALALGAATDAVVQEVVDAVDVLRDVQLPDDPASQS